jgi:uncharacterized membrane protein (DUF4010 family)
MLIRVGVVVALFGPALLAHLAVPLAAAVVVVIAVALAVDPPWREPDAPPAKEEAVFSNPFELRAVLGFAALLAFILVLTKLLTQTFGGAGSIALAAIAGLADVDAVTLSMTSLAGEGGGAVTQATIAILVVVASNTLSKCGMALFVGGRQFGLAYLGACAAAIAAGAAAALVLGLA